MIDDIQMGDGFYISFATQEDSYLVSLHKDTDDTRITYVLSEEIYLAKEKINLSILKETTNKKGDQ